MQQHIEKLVKLQTVDLERARLTTALRALPTEVAHAQAELTAAERHAAETSDALSREESLRTKLDREIAAHRQKTVRFRSQLDVVKTPEQAEAIEHEIKFSSDEASRLEDEEFQSLERTEAHEAGLAIARAEVERLAAALEKIRARALVRQREFDAEVAGLNLEREGLRKEIEPQWLTRFDRLASSRGTAMSKAENQQCTGCRMGIRPQMWNQLREGELLTCDSCGRMLYWDPAFPIPAKASPPAPGQKDLSRSQAGD